MTNQGRSQSVVVGIDGSQAALDAATCAVAEAVSLGLPLRLMYVSAAKRTCRSRADAVNAEHAESALYRAETAVRDMGRPVHIETAIVRGHLGCVLVDQSRTAALVCVGSDGKGLSARWPDYHPVLGDADRALLLVRH